MQGKDTPPFAYGVSTDSGREFMNECRSAYLRMCCTTRAIDPDPFLENPSPANMRAAEEGVDRFDRVKFLMAMRKEIEGLDAYRSRHNIDGAFPDPVFPGIFDSPLQVHCLGEEGDVYVDPSLNVIPKADLPVDVLVCGTAPNRFEYKTGSLLSNRVVLSREEREDFIVHGERVVEPDPFGAHKPHEYVVRALIHVGVKAERVVGCPLLPMHPSDCEWGGRTFQFNRDGALEDFTFPNLMPDDGVVAATEWYVSALVRAIRPRFIVALGFDARRLLDTCLEDHAVRRETCYDRGRGLVRLSMHKRLEKDGPPVPVILCRDPVRAEPADFDAFLTTLHRTVQPVAFDRVDTTSRLVSGDHMRDRMAACMKVTQAAIQHGWYTLWGGNVAVGTMVQGRTLGRQRRDVRYLVLAEHDDRPPEEGFNVYDKTADLAAQAKQDMPEVSRPMQLIAPEGSATAPKSVEVGFALHTAIELSSCLFFFYMSFLFVVDATRTHRGRQIAICPTMTVHPHSGLLLVNTLGCDLCLNPPGRRKAVVLRGGPERARYLRKKRMGRTDEEALDLGEDAVDERELRKRRAEMDPGEYSATLSEVRAHNARVNESKRRRTEQNEDAKAATRRTGRLKAIARVMERSLKDRTVHLVQEEEMMSNVRQSDERHPYSVMSIHSRTALIKPLALLACWHYSLHMCLPPEHTLAWLSNVYDFDVVDAWVHRTLYECIADFELEDFEDWAELIIIEIDEAVVVAAPSPSVSHSTAQCAFFKDLMHACGFHNAHVHRVHRADVEGDYWDNLNKGRAWLRKAAGGRFHYPVQMDVRTKMVTYDDGSTQKRVA